MNMIHIKRKSGVHFEVWIEDFNQVIAEAKVLDAGDCWLVDEIYVHRLHRRKGLATKIIRKLETIKPVKPVGIENTECALGFWDKLGLVDSQCETHYELQLMNGEFDCKVMDQNDPNS